MLHLIVLFTSTVLCFVKMKKNESDKCTSRLMACRVRLLLEREKQTQHMRQVLSLAN